MRHRWPAPLTSLVLGLLVTGCAARTITLPSPAELVRYSGSESAPRTDTDARRSAMLLAEALRDVLHPRVTRIHEAAWNEVGPTGSNYAFAITERGRQLIVSQPAVTPGGMFTGTYDVPAGGTVTITGNVQDFWPEHDGLHDQNTGVTIEDIEDIVVEEVRIDAVRADVSPGGAITINGSSSFDMNVSSDNWEQRLSFVIVQAIEIEDVTIDTDGDGTHGTTIDGVVSENLAFSYDRAISDSSITVSTGVDGEFGWALSVSSDEPGVRSGKYVVTLPTNASSTVSVSQSEWVVYYFMGELTQDILDDLVIEGTLTVYDNANEQILQTPVDADDLLFSLRGLGFI